MPGIVIDKNRCVGCGICSRECSFGALVIENRKAVCDTSKCTMCSSCTTVCPKDAISMEGITADTSEKNVDEYCGVWVYAEQWNHSVHASARELLTEGRKLADALEDPLCAIVLGNQMEEQARELFDYGADKVYLMEDEQLAIPEEQRYADVIIQKIEKYKPAVLLFAATSFGRGLAPLIAASIGTGLTADCTQLEIDQKARLLEQTRPAFGGNVMATIVCKENRPQMATVRPGVFRAVKVENHSGELVREDLKKDKFEGYPKLLTVRNRIENAIRLEEAKVIFSGGAGIKDKAVFQKLEKLAESYGAAVAVSRGAVDKGFAGHEKQVGQTGTVVAPKIYVAFGISGAIQHLIGMENSDMIIAINSDKDAPIFQIADVGIVGDAEEVIEQWMRAVEKGDSKENEK